jgi:hypothetical protein
LPSRPDLCRRPVDGARCASGTVSCVVWQGTACAGIERCVLEKFAAMEWMKAQATNAYMNCRSK